MNITKICALSLASVFIGSSSQISANEWVDGVKLTRVAAYADSTVHFIFHDGTQATECTIASPSNSVLFFDESATNGKSMYATLLTAKAAGVSVNLQVDGCKIVEMYLL